MEQLNGSDIKIIIESLEYTKLRFEEYDKYPSYEFKQERIQQVNTVIEKLKKVNKSK